MKVRQACAGLQRARCLRKVVFKGKSWEALGDWRAIATNILSGISSLDSVCFGHESWVKTKDGRLVVNKGADLDEWKDCKWWI